MKFSALCKLAVAGIAISSLVACEKPQQVKPVTEVLVNTVKQYPYKNNTNYVGRLTAASDVKIQARVVAKITEVNFKDGSYVEMGTLLFKLNDNELQAALKKMEAQRDRAKTSLSVAVKNFKRGKELEPDGYISSSEIDDLEGKVDEAKASLDSAEAELETAEVTLSYTKILAPISGKIERSTYSVGDLVSPESGSLTTIVATNTMEVPFQLSENVYWQVVRKYQKLESTKKDNKYNAPIVKISLNNEEIYPYEGVISYVSNRVDPETGTMEIRATLPNPDGMLKPGQYVKVILEAPQDVDVTMIEQGAVQSDQQGDFVMIVSKDNVVNRQNVKLGKRVDTMVIVNEGLSGEETLVVIGVQRIRSGQTVKTKQIKAVSAESH
ncbi:efflux RND transporter periplasmic adaptor subunit [Colwelliaceae bacterium BS250]